MSLGTTVLIVDDHLLVKPWPHFGIVGDEGIYGYFGSASRSRAVPVIVRP